jgi:hypothetical protein
MKTFNFIAGSSPDLLSIVTLIDWVDRNINLDYFIYPVDIHNYASRKIPESLGGKAIDRVQIIPICLIRATDGWGMDNR